MKDIFLKSMFNILKKLQDVHNDWSLSPKRMKIEKQVQIQDWKPPKSYRYFKIILKIDMLLLLTVN